MAEKKPSNREQVKQIVAGIEGSIQELFQSERYADYLHTMSRFHTYSVNNTILIHMQMPNATHVAGYNKWKNQFGRHVKQGEKGLTIIAPTPFKRKIEEMKLDPDTKAPVLDEDGNAVTEEREIEIPLFKPVKVFDVSQTEGAPLPSLVSNLTGDVEQYEAFMEALRRTSPMPINMEPLKPGLDGLCNYTRQVISIREGMSQVQTVCASVHEITHATLHDKEHTRLTAAAGDETKGPPKPKDENTMEVEAESVSYTVCQYYGIETGANSLGYIATWSKDRSLPELKASLETICKTASALITSIDRHFAEVCKERGIDLTARQPEQDAPDTLEQFAADLYDYMGQLHQAGALDHPFTLDPREQSIADLVVEMQKGYFDGVRDPLNYLAEHMDSMQAKAMLKRLDGLIGAQDAPVADLPDTPEQFMGDMLDLMDRLYAAGQIDKNFPPDNREQLKANLARNLQADPSMVRAVLEKFVREGTGAAEAGALLKRLNRLTQGPDQKYDYAVEYEDSIHQFALSAYQKGSNSYGMAIFTGDEATCNDLLEKLRSGTLHFNDFRTVQKAIVSHYATKDGGQLVAFTDENDKVYLGKRENYDHWGHYLNRDNSLLHISDNWKMFNFISGGGYSVSQAILVAQGDLSQEDFAEFDALRVGVLAQFEQVEPLLFAGEPFQFVQPEQEQPAPVAAAISPPDELPDTTLDEYPVPDDSLTLDGLTEDTDLLPLSREQAVIFLEQDMTVYMVEAGKDPAMVFEPDDIMELPEGMMLAVPREEWEHSPEFQRAVLDRMQHQKERERAFLDHSADCFAIYQVKDDDALRDIRFESLDWLKSKGRTVERGNYDLVYTAPLPAADSVEATLDQLWYQFNNEHPADFQHPSMSVSDIIALNRGGVVTCYYCDSFGFAQLPDFLTPKPTVAELEAQVKAGQAISLTDLAGVVHREKGQKQSVVAQLKNQPQPGRKKTVPQKGAEMEI